MRPLVAAVACAWVVGLLAPSPVAAQRGVPPSSTVDTKAVAEAYETFLLARRYQDTEEVDKAIDAYRRAMQLDPTSSSIPAALADLYESLDRLDEAADAAERAIKIAPDNRDAHRVLGRVYATRAMAETGRTAAARQSQEGNLDRAIGHLEGATKRPEDGGLVDLNDRALLARLYIARTRYAEAIPLLGELVREEPGWTDGASLLVEAYAAAGRTPEAIQWLEQSAPDNPALYQLLAELYAEARRWSDASNAYERAIEIAPRSVDLRVRYASMLLESGNDEDVQTAREVLREAIAIRNNNEQVLYLLSQAERRTGEYDAAEQTARQLISVNEMNPRGYAALVEALAERYRYQDIVSALVPAVQRFRGTRNSAFPLTLLLPHLGFAYQRLGQYPQAIAAFEEAGKLSGGDGVLSIYLAQVYLDAGQPAQAATLLRAVRMERPDDVRLAQLESQALRQSGRTDDGLRVLSDLVSRRPEDPDAHVALAHAYSQSSRGAQAIKTLQDARAKFPEQSTTISFELGSVYERQKQYQQAEAAFREVIARDPDHAPALNYLGYMLADRGDRLPESVALIERAVALEPENGAYLDSLGWAHFKEGRFTVAEEYLRKAAERMVTNSVIQDHYGDVLFELGRFDAAIAAWQLALNGDRDSIEPGDIQRKIQTARTRLSQR